MGKCSTHSGPQTLHLKNGNNYCFYFKYFVLLLNHSVVSDSSWPHRLHHARLSHPSLSPGVCSNSCPLSQWCHPTISSFSPLPPSPPALKSFPASGSFPVSQLFASGGQSIMWPLDSSISIILCMCVCVCVCVCTHVHAQSRLNFVTPWM